MGGAHNSGFRVSGEWRETQGRSVKLKRDPPPRTPWGSRRKPSEPVQRRFHEITFPSSSREREHRLSAKPSIPRREWSDTTTHLNPWVEAPRCHGHLPPNKHATPQIGYERTSLIRKRLPLGPSTVSNRQFQEGNSRKQPSTNSHTTMLK